MGNAINKQEFIKNDSKRSVIMESKITYDKISELEIRQKFNDAILSGKIQPCKYKDNEWILSGRLKDSYRYIRFDELSNDMKEKVKAFVICLLDIIEPESTGSYIYTILDILSVTNELTDTSVEVIEYLNSKELHKAIYSAIVDFFEFIGLRSENTRIFREALAGNLTDFQSRDLPVFQSVLAFDSIINEFIREDLDRNQKYYPIVLWWKLTMVIPMRPIEFFTLKQDNFYSKNENYYIKIERSLKSDPKNKKSHKIDLMTDFRITKSLYESFQKYIKTVDVGEEGYIFNTNGHGRLKREREYIGRSIYAYLLKDFYDNIIVEKYGYTVIEKATKQFLDEKEIEKINFGDTRHLAFLNLIISGYNPYTIAQLGGHRQLSSQMSYYSGATSYCTSKAFSFALGIDNLDVKTMPIAEWRQHQIMLNSTDLSKAIKIEGGYCTSPNFPYECYTATCRSDKCKYFVNRDGSILDKEIKEVEDDINHKVELLRLMIYKEPNDCVERAEIVGALKDQILALGGLYKNKINNGGK